MTDLRSHRSPGSRLDEPVTVDTPPGGVPKIRRNAVVYQTNHRWKRRLGGTLLAFVVVVVVAAAGLFGYTEYRYHQIAHVTVGNLPAAGAGQPMNILMVGNNERCGLNDQQTQSFGSCGDNGGSEVAGARSDVIMILHLDPATSSASILSIPRDLVVPVPGYQNEMKIDSSLNYGPKVLIQTIEADFGITINHFVMLNFDSFQGVVNALGGINMYFPMPVYDMNSSLNAEHVLQTGCLHLDGFQALALVRSREMWYYSDGLWTEDPDGDLSRIRRDHEFLTVLGTEVEQRGLADPLTDNSLLASVVPQLTVDSGLGLSTMLGLVEHYHSVNPTTMEDFTLPVVTDPDNQYYVDGYGIGSVVFPSEPYDQNAIDAWLGSPGPPAVTVSPSSVSVEVVNSSGVDGLGSTAEQQLQSAGFPVSDGGDVPPIASPAETFVVYDGPSKLQDAERVAENFSGAVLLEDGSTPSGVDVVVDVTSNAVFNTLTSGGAASAGYAVAAPVTSPSGSAAVRHSASASVPPSPTTVPPATTTTTSPIGPASNSQNPLEPWDPRACPAGMPAVTAQFNS